MLAEGIFVRKKALSGLLADKDDFPVVESLVGSESATAKDGYSSGGEVARVSGANQEIQTAAFGNGRVLEDGDEEISTPALAGSRADQSRCFDAGHGTNSAKEFFHECCFLHGLVVANSGQIEPHGEDVVGGNAKVGGAQAQIALQEQAGTDEQNDGKSDLSGKQSAAEPSA